jgi:hypothetical protein
VLLAVVLFFGGLAFLSIRSLRKAAKTGEGAESDKTPTETRTGPPSGGHED